MSFTPDQLRGKGFTEQADGSFTKGAQIVKKCDHKFIGSNHCLKCGWVPHGVSESPSSIPNTPRQPVAHENERQLQEQIANWLRLHDTWFFRSRMDKRSTNTVGTPDFLCSISGVPVAIECKMPGNDLSDEQKQAKLLMQANGWQHWTVYRLEEVIAGIRLIEEMHL